MKKLKVFLTTILVGIILTLSTNVYAVTVDNTGDSIIMPNSITNGEGTISFSPNLVAGKMVYQFVKISNEGYNEVIRLKEKINVIALRQAYEEEVLPGQANDETIPSYRKFQEAKNAYDTKYPNDKFSNGIVYDDAYMTATSNALTEVYKKYAMYTDNWAQSDNNKVSIDLTGFSGTQKYLLWIKYTSSADANASVYNANVYEIKGTKKNNGNNEKPNNNATGGDNTTEGNNKINGNNTTIGDNNIIKEEDKNGNSNTKTPTSSKTDTTSASSEGKVLPKTGISNVLLTLIVIGVVSAGISYKKYRKIK